MTAVKGRILALARMMPPLVFPRALQVSRTLRCLTRWGWDITVVTIEPQAEVSGSADDQLATFYKEAYRQIFVEPREDVQQSPLWLRAWRKKSPPNDIRANHWLRRTENVMRRELKAHSYDAMVTFAQPWIDHMVGLKIKRRHPNLPWVAHFSDP